jgi:hypothetical protein
MATELDAIGRFADPSVTATIDLGPCRCPGTPHERDSAQVRSQIGDGELRSAYATAVRVDPDGERYFDEAAGDDAAAARFTRSWTLLDAAGEPVPITPAWISRLDTETRTALLAPLNAAIAARSAPLPNGSGARSPGSSRASASRTPTTRRRP